MFRGNAHYPSLAVPCAWVAVWWWAGFVPSPVCFGGATPDAVGFADGDRVGVAFALHRAGGADGFRLPFATDARAAAFVVVGEEQFGAGVPALSVHLPVPELGTGLG